SRFTHDSVGSGGGGLSGDGMSGWSGSIEHRGISFVNGGLGGARRGMGGEGGFGGGGGGEWVSWTGSGGGGGYSGGGGGEYYGVGGGGGSFNAGANQSNLSAANAGNGSVRIELL
ncbi:MAG: hypothetical protein H0U74_12210, partial [Bradymonadaceae bacterium]|nr:hypothetical protein [Lujinxingiaceae bacterium]